MIHRGVGPVIICLCLSYGCNENTTATKTEAPATKAEGTKETAARNTGAQTSMSAPRFAEAAAVGDLYEVESSRLANMKASSSAVREFASMMVADHTATTDQLKQIATNSTPAIALPMQPDARHQAMLDELMTLDGMEFDRRYVAQQTEAHREAVMLMEGFAEDGDQQELKQFAAATAPKIRMHLQMVEQLGQQHR